jgi:Uma2 family endonuclease
MGDPNLAPRERFTYRHYKTWPDDERWELIDGLAWAMSPAPLRRHQGIQARLIAEIAAFLRGKPCEVYGSPFDVLLPEEGESDEEAGTVVQPDIVVYCDKTKLTREGARGAPDLVVEILSPRTAKKDFGVKYVLYERHGAREYLVVDPDAEVIHAWRLGEDGRYGEETIYEAGDTAPSEVLAGLAIDLNSLFADAIDR